MLEVGKRQEFVWLFAVQSLLQGKKLPMFLPSHGFCTLDSLSALQNRAGYFQEKVCWFLFGWLGFGVSY